MKKKSVRSDVKSSASKPVPPQSSGISPQAPRTEPAFARYPLTYMAASILLLAPCFWQSRLQAGDLSSHIYNAWLAQLISRGQAPGLSIAPQSTNVLFDWMLSALFQCAGAGAAQRISAALAVLVFGWGAFAFVSVVSERFAWRIMPWVVVLSYGWVFHMGFFNFYLSLGLCFWALAFAWSGQMRGLAIAAAILAVGYLAHALPVFWTIGVLAYIWLARRSGTRNQLKLLGAALLAVVALRMALSSLLVTRWSGQQITLITGVDQLWVFDDKYLPLAAGTLLIWGVWLWRNKGFWRSLQFQICLITAAGILLIPSAISIPGYKHSLVYIAERMSLVLGICVCAVLATGPSRSYDRYLTSILAVLFFAMLYRDERLLNLFEDRVNTAVTQVPANARVIGSIEQSSLRVNALAHMVDRSCVGRCYSYANYEPSTAQFRVRVNGENPIVAATYADSFGMQNGRYMVKERDLPLYQLLADDNGQIQIRIPAAGQPCGITAWSVL
jgi:hypothetical protein